MKVMFGGSFNPPTIAHLAIINDLLIDSNIELVIVPNGDIYKLKNLESFIHRKKMLEIMIKDLKRVAISDIECQEEFKGTYYTLKSLENPIMVIGDDSLISIDKWINFPNLIKENRFIVYTRQLTIREIEDFIRNHYFLKEYSNHFEIRKIDMNKISSSNFRTNHDIDSVTKEVAIYIKENHLFEVKNV